MRVAPPFTLPLVFWLLAVLMTSPMRAADDASPCAGSGVGAAATAPCLDAGAKFADCSGCPDMVVVPAGSFMMGSPEDEVERAQDEGPQHRVAFARPFAVGRTEVTFEQWDACVADGGCGHAPRDPGWGRGKRPVVNVSWDDITGQYLPWLSRKTGQTYRLPTEAEWEYAARAGTRTPFHTGDHITTDDANFDGTGSYAGSARGVYRQKTLEAGSFKPNAFGLHDMHGNVWEWVADCFAEGYDGAAVDGSARGGPPGCARVLRGGSWIDRPRVLRSAYRGHLSAQARFIYRGFRLARDL